MERNNTINYLEIPVKDMGKAKEFFTAVFGFKFTDYGPGYSSFANAGIDGGFYQSEAEGFSAANSPLIVFYSSDLEQIQKKVVANNGVIVREIFSFPGGRRFHFQDPNGNEYAIWSE